MLIVFSEERYTYTSGLNSLMFKREIVVPKNHHVYKKNKIKTLYEDIPHFLSKSCSRPLLKVLMESIVPYGRLLVCEKYHKQIIIKTNIS
jgi:hypothetical protein